MLVVRDTQDREIELRKLERLRLGVDDMQPKRREEAQDAPRFRRARRVVIAGDHHDLGLRQRGAQARELHVGVNDRAVRGAHLVKHISAHQHHRRRELDHLVDRAGERLRDVRLPLIDATRSQPLILAESEMQVGEVDEAQMLPGEGEGAPRARR
jgi:hypothetical protein